MKYEDHKRHWKNCQKCPLWKSRHNVVLARGKVPSDILFIGEAPGVTEDHLGTAFKGPAGQLLDQIIASAIEQYEGQNKPSRWAFTNVIACIPLEADEDGKLTKLSQPPSKCIRSCSERLREFVVEISKPRGIITVGQVAEKAIAGMTPKILPLIPRANIVHPAAILRGTDEASQDFAIRRAIVGIQQFLYDHFDKE